MTRNISYFAWRNVSERLALAKIWLEEDCTSSFVDVSIDTNFYGCRKRVTRNLGSAPPVNALPTHHRFIRTNGAAEFRRLVFGFIDDPVTRRASGRA
ncbi:unnamed protein product [Lasius platythorax]|uniref:Reverse transcriptase n=1 Tax=Lasius platythorax TaxID=488582 RepID=A0AAV2NIY1_9HYME